MQLHQYNILMPTTYIFSVVHHTLPANVHFEKPMYTVHYPADLHQYSTVQHTTLHALLEFSHWRNHCNKRSWTPSPCLLPAGQTGLASTKVIAWNMTAVSFGRAAI